MSKVKIEVLTDFRHVDEEYTLGETRFVEKDLCEYFCRAGWAKSEGVATGTPGKNDVVLMVENVKVSANG